MNAADRYPPELLARVRRLAEAQPAREACGLVTRGAAGWRVAALPNASRAPDSYLIAPAALLAALRQLEGAGEELVAFWHSHLDAPAGLSRRDREAATAGGRPLWPGVEHLVVSLRGGRAADVARYRFSGSELEEAPLRSD